MEIFYNISCDEDLNNNSSGNKERILATKITDSFMSSNVMLCCNAVYNSPPLPVQGIFRRF